MFGSSDQNLTIKFDNMVAAWGGVSHPQLSVVLVWLEHLSRVHQSHHWIARGDSFYGDHLMFERVYKTAHDHIDKLAEKMIGLGMDSCVDLNLRSSQLGQMSSDYGAVSTLPSAAELAKRSLHAEKSFLAILDTACSSLREEGLMTRGLDNLLSEIYDEHESSVYLLQQRCK